MKSFDVIRLGFVFVIVGFILDTQLQESKLGMMLGIAGVLLALFSMYLLHLEDKKFNLPYKIGYTSKLPKED